ncbi:MAG: coproporphyrinogen III oxidase [Candidatus Schekmanbacteria bacterium]|nr:MAG: coproporphyrinogen III oxidase [Candidatus Schekmanbacteria bacterium]
MLTKDEVVDFLQQMIGEYEKICSTYNPSSEIVKKKFDTPMGPLYLNRSEGETFDKATSIYCDLKIETPPVLAEELGQQGSTADAMVLELHFFPVNPHIPKAYIELRANITDKVVLAGGTDIKPYFDTEEDIKYFADAMKELCKRHGKSYDSLQKVRADFFKSKYSGEKVGSHAGIYSFHLEAEDFPFYKDMGETYIKLVRELTEKRKDQKYTDDDINCKLKQHGEWVQWTLLEDDGTIFGLKKGIPAEALLGAILPPLAKF